MLLFWPLVIPFGTAVACILAGQRRGLVRLLSMAGAAALLAVAAVILVQVVRSGPFADQAGGWPAPFGITMVADGLSATMVLLTALVALLTLTFGLADLTEDEERYGHHPLTHALLAGLCGAFLTGDIFNLYVWFEVMLIASFGLLVLGGGPAALDGATKYVGLNLIATVAFISGVGLLYGATGALNMADLHGRLAGRGGETAILASAAFLIFAFGAKAALFPLLFWLPASYHTPSFPTSALFAALLTKVGVYALIRSFTLVYPVEGTPIAGLLIAGSLATMAIGAMGALVMPTLRRTFGFTIVSSIGTIVLGLGVGTPLALAGAIFTLWQDVAVKANLFLSGGAIRRLTGSETLGETGGIWRNHAGVAMLFLVPALSLAGIPPFAGFWGKFMMLQALMDAQPLLAAALLVTGFLSLLAMARLWSGAIWSPPDTPPPDAPAASERLPAAMLLPLLILAGMLVAGGIWAGGLVEAATSIAAGLVDPAAYVAAVLGPRP